MDELDLEISKNLLRRHWHDCEDWYGLLAGEKVKKGQITRRIHM